MLRYIRSGSGTPAVVIDQGAGVSIEESFLRPVALGWPRVFRQIGKLTRVVMHDRAGLGWSTDPPGPRTSAEMVGDLRRVLRDARVPPPYVLVGHSIGGFNARLFASEHPREVAGVALVESSHPDQWRRFAKLLPPQTVRESAILQRLRGRLDPAVTPERLDFTMSAEQIRSARPLGAIPLIVLSRSPRAVRPPGLPAEIAGPMEAIWSELQQELASLSSRGRRIVAAHGGHNLQLDEPQLVADAILDLVRGARTGEALH
ncbi:MAG: alpha/beta fold hydrolase [Steroidobacteraceae bacterium]